MTMFGKPTGAEGKIVATEMAPGEWLVSEHNVWVEGIYATEEAARMAVKMDPDELAMIWGWYKPRPLTVDDLRYKNVEGP